MLEVATARQSTARAAVSALAVVALAALSSAAAAGPVIHFTKSPKGQTINPGDTATFTFVISNSGDASAAFPQITDNLPGGSALVWTTTTDGCLVVGPPGAQVLECDLPFVDPGNSLTVTVSAVVPTCMTLNNTASVSVENATPDTIFDTGLITAPCARGVFVIGDVEPHAAGNTVNFWGSQWWKNNALSGAIGSGVASFKGFATDFDGTCGGTWQSRPGNSSNPPDTIPADIMVVVTDTVTKNGNNIGGKVKQIVNVHSDGGYGPAPGHPGSGKVTGIVCPQ